jgi:hypothetical protein
MTVKVADTHAHVQRPISVFKMETMLEECNIGKPLSVVCFFGARRTQCKGYS